MTQTRSQAAQVLGVSPDASSQEIRRAYLNLARKTHPDKAGDETEFKRVYEAYQVLTSGAEDGAAEGAGGFGDFFSTFFGKTTRTGDSFKVNVPLTALVNGAHSIIKMKTDRPCKMCPAKLDECTYCRGSGHVFRAFPVGLARCPQCKGRGSSPCRDTSVCMSCKGTGTVRGERSIELVIPPGVPDGHVVFQKGSGSYDPMRSRDRDARITLNHVLPEGVRLYGNDLHVTVSVPLMEILDGFERTLELYDEKILVKTTGYHNPTKPLVLAGRGIPDFVSGTRGDLVVAVDVIWP